MAPKRHQLVPNASQQAPTLQSSLHDTYGDITVDRIAGRSRRGRPVNTTATADDRDATDDTGENVSDRGAVASVHRHSSSVPLGNHGGRNRGGKSTGAGASDPTDLYSADVPDAASSQTHPSETGRKRPRDVTDAEVVAALEKKLVDYRDHEKTLKELQGRRQVGNLLAAMIAAAKDPSTVKYPVVRLIVGGEAFTVPIITLLSRDPNSYFLTLLSLRNAKDEQLKKDCETTERMAKVASSAHKLCGACDDCCAPVGDASSAAAGTAEVPYEKQRGSEDGETQCDSPVTTQAAGGVPTAIEALSAQLIERQAQSSFPAEVFVDSSGAIFIDRDPATFRYILNYLRGYNQFHMLGKEELAKLRIDAQYFHLQGLQELIAETDTTSSLQFPAGPGINREGNRFRVVYSVATIGDTFIMTGRHSITFQVLCNDYLGLGFVSDAFTNADAEFHKTLNCSVYYMSGVFYTNFPNYRKEEGLTRFENGDYVTIEVDMDKGFAEIRVRRSSKLFSINGARRLKFAAVLKLGSKVRIATPEEAVTQNQLFARERASGESDRNNDEATAATGGDGLSGLPTPAQLQTVTAGPWSSLPVFTRSRGVSANPFASPSSSSNSNQNTAGPVIPLQAFEIGTGNEEVDVDDGFGGEEAFDGEQDDDYPLENDFGEEYVEGEELDDFTGNNSIAADEP